jgi:proteasome accessory factor B
MSKRKNERLLNLLFALMSTRTYLSRSTLKEILEEYQTLDQSAFERKFERDKDDLRSLGVPIEVGRNSENEDVDGYRVNLADIQLPELDMQPEEGAIVAVAAKVWQGSAMGDAVTTTLRKLQTIGVDVETESIPLLTAEVSTGGSDAIEAFVESIQMRRVVTFDYADSQGAHTSRTLQPWGLLNWRDRWYVGGFDLVRDEPRLFRLSRIVGKPKATGKPDGYEIPENASLRDIATKMFTTVGDREAVLRLAPNRCQTLRQKARAIESTPSGDIATVPFSDLEDFAAEVCSFGSAALVQEPADLKELVISKLKTIAGVA